MLWLESFAIRKDLSANVFKHNRPRFQVHEQHWLQLRLSTAQFWGCDAVLSVDKLTDDHLH